MQIISLLYSIPYIIIYYLLIINMIPLFSVSFDSNIKLINNYIIFNYIQKIYIIILLGIFFGLRGYVLHDWRGYSQQFENSPTLFSNINIIKKYLSINRFERGFLLFIIICKTISTNYIYFQLLSVIIDLFILNYIFTILLPNKVVMCFTFFLLFSGISLEMQFIRNSKSILLFLLSIDYLKDRKLFMYLFLNIVGSLFHITSLLYIPLYFILNKNISRKLILLIFIIGNIIFLLKFRWIKNILMYISFPGRIGVLINKYLSSELYSGNYGFSIGYLERSFSFILIFILSKKIKESHITNNIFINSFYIYIFIFLYFSEMSIFLERVAELFVFSYWILYPRIYELISNKLKKIFILLLLIYGTLKLCSLTNKFYYSYDNVLFNYKSSYERKLLLKQNNDNILKIRTQNRLGK